MAWTTEDGSPRALSEKRHAHVLTCTRARNTDTFQVVVYEAQLFSQCVMGRFLFLTHNERGDFMLRVIKWKLHGKVCFTLDKTHQEKGTIVT